MCLIGIVRLFVDKEKNWLAQSPSKNKILLAFAVTGKAKVSQLHIINVIESDSRDTIPDITKDVGLSLSRVHFILKRILNVRKISAIWILHILTDDQKWVRVRNVIVLLKNVSQIQTKTTCKYCNW